MNTSIENSIHLSDQLQVMLGKLELGQSRLFCLRDLNLIKEFQEIVNETTIVLKNHPGNIPLEEVNRIIAKIDNHMAH